MVLTSILKISVLVVLMKKYRTGVYGKYVSSGRLVCSGALALGDYSQKGCRDPQRSAELEPGTDRQRWCRRDFRRGNDGEEEGVLPAEPRSRAPEQCELLRKKPTVLYRNWGLR